jgi:TonB family protein
MVVVTNAMVKIKKLNVMLMAGNAMHLVLIIGGSIVITSLAQMQDIREIYSLQFMPKEPIPSKNAAASSLVNRIGGISLAKTLNHVTNSSTYMKKQPFPKEGVLPNNLGRAGVNNETQSSPAFKMENITNETRKLGAFDTSAVQSASNTSDQTAPHATSAKLLNQARSVRFQESSSTNLEIISKPTAQYTPEARKDKIQGDVVLRVTFRADGHVLVLEVVRGLGYGLDEEARRIAEQIRFRPATRDGKAIDVTTTIIITFQLA